MKKLFTLLAAVLIVSVSFAQVMPAPKVIKNTRETIKIGNPEMKSHNDSKSATSAWFNYVADLENYWGEELEGFAPPILCDTVGLYPYSDGNSPVQIFGVGHTHNLNWNDWIEFYQETASMGENIPALSTGSSYSIDSVQILARYTRGTAMDANVVDTLIFSYVINMDDESAYNLSISQSPAFATYYVPYNSNTHSASNLSNINSSMAYTHATVVLDTILLTAEDAATDEEGYFYYWNFPAPAGLTNVTGKVNAITYTFVPGVARTTTSLIGTDMSSFRIFINEDPRSEYTTLGSDELMNYLCNGLVLNDWSIYGPSTIFCYGAYCPGEVYQDQNGNMVVYHPYVSFYATCNDCSNVNVEDMEKDNITVYPNPASTNLTVTLAGNEAATVQLFNLVGQQVYSETAVNTANINVNNFKAGVYMLKVSQNGKVYTSKVVVK